ncbi:MFS transporter [Streptomyces sp. NPDC006798]|uniref:MFS transporter n=1 Tax=Streptomyces sp. NPDC006798 TaxID=3155462 RepID=UPI0033EDA2CF
MSSSEPAAPGDISRISRTSRPAAPPRTAGPSPGSAAPPSGTGRRPPGLWRDRDFRAFFTSVTLSLLSTSVSYIALPLIAVLALGAGPGEVGLLATLGTVAFLLIGLPAGAWLDRLDHRRVMVCAEVTRAVVFLSVPLAWALDALTLWQLYAVALIGGCAMVFFDVGTQSVLPGLVGPERLIRANTAVVTLHAAGQVTGRGAGGLVISAISAPLAALATGLLHLASALRLATLKNLSGGKRSGTRSGGGPSGAVPAGTAPGAARDTAPGARAPRRPGLAAEIGEGLRHVLGRPELRALVVIGMLTNLGAQLVMALMPVLFTQELGMSAGVLGLFWSVAGIGVFLGARLARPLGERFGYGRTIAWSGLVCSPMALLIPLIDRGWWLGLAAFGLMTDCVRAGVFNVLGVTLRQSMTPDELLGRMNATFRFLFFGALAVGAGLAGLIGQFVDIRAALWAGSVSVTLVALPAFIGLRRGSWWRGGPPAIRTEPAGQADRATAPADPTDRAETGDRAESAEPSGPAVSRD